MSLATVRETPEFHWPVRPLKVWAANGNSFELLTELSDREEIIAAADQQLGLREHGWLRFRLDHMGGQRWRLTRIAP